MSDTGAPDKLKPVSYTHLVTIVGTLCFMLGINPLIALVVVLVTPLSLFVAVFVAKSSNKMFKEQTKTQGELGGCVEEMLGSQKVVKAFSYEERAEEKFQEINARLYNCLLYTSWEWRRHFFPWPRP